MIELEKNRHIMAFKTSEMRSSLEPKELKFEIKKYLTELKKISH